jgi:Bacterial pre-peptidase C-terminal domain
MTWNAVNSNKEVSSIYTVKEYIVESLTDNSLSTEKVVSPMSIEKDREPKALTTATGNIVSLRSIQSVNKGVAKYYKVSVDSGVTSLEVDLNWGNKNNSLSLTITTPSGETLGTDHDNSDGKVDGRIHIKIRASAGGYLKQGTWMFKVYGELVSGTEDYTFNFYAHH